MTTLVVGTSKGAGIFSSSSDRNSWTLDRFVLQGWSVSAAARDTQGTTYLALSSDVYGPTVMKSTDLVNWTQTATAPSYAPTDKGNHEHNRIIGAKDPMGRYDNDQRHVDQIWNLHCAGEKIYAGVSEAGLFVSEDQGETWAGVDGFNNHPERDKWIPGFGGLCAHTILSDAKNPDRMWVGVSSCGAFRTDDGGKTWVGANEGVSLSEGFCVHSMTHDPANPDVIYRQDHRGFYRSDDAGDTWAVKENGLPIAQLSDDHKCVFGFPSAFDPKSGSIFAVPLDGDNFRFPKDGELAVYRSQDNCENWQRMDNGLPSNVFSSVLRNALAVDEESPAGVYFGTASGAVYASSDLGESWITLPSSFPRILCVEAFS